MEKKEDYFIEVKTSFTNQIINKSANEIAVEYSYMTLTENLSFISEVFNKLEIDLEGEGMEVAAGAAVLPCSLARLYPAIKKIHALEIVSEVVHKLQPKIIEETGMTGRVIPLVGDFNDIKMPSNSLDFVVGYSSLHHSNDLNRTLTEIGRVLKPGGKLIFFDRAQPNHMTKDQENFLLNKEYGREYKIKHGLDLDKPYRRFEEGEHEPRFRDWNTAFTGTGLQIDSITVFTQRTFKQFVFSIISFIPFALRKYFNFYPSIIETRKLFGFYIFPFIGNYGKLKILTLRTKFKTPPVFTSMKHTVFIASKTK